MGSSCLSRPPPPPQSTPLALAPSWNFKIISIIVYKCNITNMYYL